MGVDQGTSPPSVPRPGDEGTSQTEPFGSMDLPQGFTPGVIKPRGLRGAHSGPAQTRRVPIVTRPPASAESAPRIQAPPSTGVPKESRIVTEAIRLADPGIRGTDATSEHDAGAENELIGEAKDDWDNGAVPVLEEIRVYLDKVSQPTKDECKKLIVRIERNGGAIASHGANASQNSILALTIDLLALTDAVDNAAVVDDDEMELLALIREKIKGKLALRVWSVLARLGKLQQWTVNGEISISLFGMATGKGALSITFGK